MGIFDFFKKKVTEQKTTLIDNYILTYFGQININDIEEYYSSNFELKNNTIRIDLNFENKMIEKMGIEKIETFIKNIEDFDKKNKVYIEKDFNEESGETSDYINFYLDELYEAQLEKIIDINNQIIPKNVQLLKKLKLIRVGIYPDRKYGASYFATFDYSIDVDGEPCNQLLVVNTDESGKLDHITWES